jgi:hypothetical protein
MIGIGSLVYVVNVLPFAYLIVSPIIFRRYNFLGMNPYSSSSRNYYKRFWFRALFGRLQVHLYAVGGLLYTIYLLGIQREGNEILLQFTSFLSEIEEFQEEDSPQHGKALAKYRYDKNMNVSRDLVLQNRAELHREMKIRAFNEIQNENKNDFI